MGIEPDRLVEKANAFRQAFLLKPNGAQDRKGYGASLWIVKGQSGLLVGLLQMSLLDQAGGPFKGLARVSPKSPSSQEQKRKQGEHLDKCPSLSMRAIPVTTSNHCPGRPACWLEAKLSPLLVRNQTSSQTEHSAADYIEYSQYRRSPR